MKNKLKSTFCFEHKSFLPNLELGPNYPQPYSRTKFKIIYIDVISSNLPFITISFI